jgi:N-formylglutamate deformylase
MTDAVFTLHRGSSPLLLSLPHVGTHIPGDIAQQLQPRALEVENTDWHLEAVYDFAHSLGASVLVPRCSRYVIDLNRPPQNTPMYPGVNNTELCPTRFFSGDTLYRPGHEPDTAQVDARLQAYWQPYHQALEAELARLKAAHGHALLWDGHSIQSQLPWLFEGRPPDLNLGTVAGTSCAPKLRSALMAALAAQSHFSHVTDGRFKGGYITRHYGRPAQGLHALQMEMCFRTYMDEEAPPWALSPRQLARLRPVLQTLLQTLLAWRPDAEANAKADAEPNA